MSTLDRTRAFHCALASAIVLLLITESPRLQSFIAPEPPPAVQVEGRYLPAPGNRFTCPEVNSKGHPYIGWLATQADGSAKPVRHTCVYASARVL